jgi:hypothetical protein
VVTMEGWIKLGWSKGGRTFIVDLPPYTKMVDIIAAPVLAYKEVVK